MLHQFAKHQYSDFTIKSNASLTIIVILNITSARVHIHERCEKFFVPSKSEVFATTLD